MVSLLTSVETWPSNFGWQLQNKLFKSPQMISYMTDRAVVYLQYFGLKHFKFSNFLICWYYKVLYFYDLQQSDCYIGKPPENFTFKSVKLPITFLKYSGSQTAVDVITGQIRDLTEVFPPQSTIICLGKGSGAKCWLTINMAASHSHSMGSQSCRMSEKAVYYLEYYVIPKMCLTMMINGLIKTPE